jgi:hypothetical protein
MNMQAIGQTIAAPRPALSPMDLSIPRSKGIFPAYFRVELAWAKLLGVVLVLAAVPAWLKEWAYAGFAITLGSALIAHLSVGDGPEAWGWAAGTGVLWGLSYFFWRRVQHA